MEKRETFGSRLGFILVSAGCAIGLGNVWKFPYICGKNGGAVFIVIYLLCLLLLGLPILICEFTIGRGSQKSIVSSFDQLEPENTRWHQFKYFGIAGNYLLMMFYTMVGGWMLFYAYRSIMGEMSGMNPDAVTGSFMNMLKSPDIMVPWTIVTIAIAFFICSLGMQKGVEKISKVIMSLLIVLLIILAIRSITLKNAMSGVKFYLVPDIGKLKENGVGNVVFAAMSHAFFTLGVGVGSMEIFGSYLDKSRRLTGEAISIVCLDTAVAIISGLIIIPACFAYGVQPDSGPSLLFITLPNVFNHMDNGRLWGSFFFVFMSFAALSTIIAVFENIIAMTCELFGWDRKKSVGVNLVLLIVLSMPAVLGYNIWSGFQPLGAGTSFMDLEDFLVSYNILPIGCITIVLFCVKKNGWGWNHFLEEVNEGEGIRFPERVRGYMLTGLPAIISVIYLKGYYDYFAPFGKRTVAVWMVIGVCVLALTFRFGINKKHKK